MFFCHRLAAARALGVQNNSVAETKYCDEDKAYIPRRDTDAKRVKMPHQYQVITRTY